MSAFKTYRPDIGYWIKILKRSTSDFVLGFYAEGFHFKDHHVKKGEWPAGVFFFFFFSTNSAREKLKLRVVISLLLLLLMFLLVVITGVTWTTAGCGEEQGGNREEKVSKCPGWKGSFSNYLVSWFWLEKKNNNNDQLVFYTSSTVIIQWNSSVRTRFLLQLLWKLKADVEPMW